jgi:hypothetical protein
MSDTDLEKLAKIVKLHEPTLKAPVAKMGAGLAEIGMVSEISSRLPEFIKPLKFFVVGIGLTAGDLAGHQFFPVLEGDKTPKGYYGSLLLFSIPALIVGRLAADIIGGPPMLKAVVIATAANLAMQTRFLFGDFAKGFNMTNFLIHEALLIPLSILIAGDDASMLKSVVASKEHA